MSKAILVIDIPNEWLEYENEKIEDLMVSYTLYSHKTTYDEAYSKPLKPLGLKTKTDGYVLYSTEYLKKNFETEYMLWKDLYGNE